MYIVFKHNTKDSKDSEKENLLLIVHDEEGMHKMCFSHSGKAYIGQKSDTCMYILCVWVYTWMGVIECVYASLCVCIVCVLYVC